METLLKYKLIDTEEEPITNEDNSTVTFVKWAGGKSQLISQLKPLLPKKVNRYFEPFVGGGAMFFYLAQNYSISYVMLSDINLELINVYRVIRDDVKNLIMLLRKHAKKHRVTPKAYYYNIRSQEMKDASHIERAARFVYLNKTCYNGLYRVNAKNKFNVPIGSSENPAILQEDKLIRCSKLLENASLKLMSFDKISNYAEYGNFVYLDPPYYPAIKGKNFTSYQKNKFMEEEHKKLFEVFKKLDAKGALCMLSNSNTKFIKDLYKEYNQTIVKSRRMINCNGNGRGETEELVIDNYNWGV